MKFNKTLNLITANFYAFFAHIQERLCALFCPHVLPLKLMNGLQISVILGVET